MGDLSRRKTSNANSKRVKTVNKGDKPQNHGGSKPFGPLVVLGVVVRPHGVCGDLLVKLFNPDSDFIFRQKEILLSNRALQERVRITRLHRHGESFVLMTIAGCDSRARAEQWRGFDLCVERSALPRLSPGEFYYSDLIDLKVTTPQGVTVGEVKEVITYPTADVLSVTSGAGYIEIPMVEPYWVELDLEAGIIVVDHIDDLSWFYPGRKKKG